MAKEKLESVLDIPLITLWNRLEGRPRTSNFDRALKAEVRDALWMLSKQWQTGEFRGEDAASVVLAKVHIKTTALTHYQPGTEPKASLIEDEIPLEVKLEHQAIPFQLGSQQMALDLRLLMGRQWLKMLKKEGFSLKNKYLNQYGFAMPKAESDIQATAHIGVWKQFAAVAKRSVDGYRVYYDLKKGSHKVSPPQGREKDLQALGKKFIRWFEQLYFQPVDKPNPSWRPNYLEYQFACSAPYRGKEKVFIADEYYHGHLDWHNLDVHDKKTELPQVENEAVESSVEKSFTLSFIPSSGTFPSMPNKRWWALEDWRTNLGKINPDKTDINQLLVLDYVLNYANDWSILPFTLPVGSIADVEGLMVTNAFGEHIWIEAAGQGRDEEWQRWSMFHLNTRGNAELPADMSLLLLPAAPKVMEGKPCEEVFLLRDEVANMVWAVETMIPLATGSSKRGKEAGIELRDKYQQLEEKNQSDNSNQLPEVENEAKIRYRLVNTLPEHWIPFIPVHKDADKRSIQLQRAALPRVLVGAKETDPPAKIEPRTSILRVGLDQKEKKPYYIHEEEVPRAGIKVHKSFQRTRWYNGRVFTWLGFRKQVGKGEGYSGLTFDQLIPKE